MDVSKIGKVASVAKTNEQQSAKALKQGQQTYQQKQQQLEQLQNFKKEYEDKLGVMGEQGISARQLQDYRLFLSKLNHAIDQQSEEVKSSQQSLEALQQQWLDKSRRKTALDHLVDQQHKKDAQTREQTEQKESDESSLVRMMTLTTN
jgi:flagellar FliJ protein